MEKLVIIHTVYPEGTEYKKRKGEVVDWSEAMRRFNLSGEELKNAIEKGEKITNNKVDYFVDESLTY